MRLCFLSGGTGTPKLLRGYTKLDPFFSVIVNVADDLWISGNKVCPDIDSVIYAIADVIDDSKWWGLRGDTFRTYDMLKTLGFNEMLKIGDLDRAVHIARSELLRKGYTLTQATRIVKNAFNIKAEILPACEENVQTYIKTSEGMMHFQEFWVLKKGKLDV
ncbi:MAG: 2-phospho-L-lactate transferase, partial [Archaeoglobus sp.]